ncbi:MAG: class I SAM-dependent methyltransferase [Defluviitaleaceae bacterium]|nr:class I SAM-dependent methyltransferase [Defluviitaleaceae bacterium]
MSCSTPVKHYPKEQDIPKRMHCIIKEIQHKTIADIGTDHGYIPIYACLFGYAHNAIACDIRPEPLIAAKKNITAHNLADRIQIRLGNGLAPIYPKEVESVIITGMGGDSIINILSDGGKVVQSLEQLVLSPQSNVPKVRRFLHGIDWKITNEEFIYTEKKHYTIIVATQGSEPPYTTGEYELGKILIQKKEPDFLAYADQQIGIYEKIRAKVKGRRLEEIEKLLEIYKELL